MLSSFARGAGTAHGACLDHLINKGTHTAGINVNFQSIKKVQQRIKLIFSFIYISLFWTIVALLIHMIQQPPTHTHPLTYFLSFYLHSVSVWWGLSPINTDNGSWKGNSASTAGFFSPLNLWGKGLFPPALLPPKNGDLHAKVFLWSFSLFLVLLCLFSFFLSFNTKQ